MGYTPACIQEINSASGFESVHGFLCARCDRDAVVHIYLSYWCGNVCSMHGTELATGRYHETDEKLRGLKEE